MIKLKSFTQINVNRKAKRLSVRDRYIIENPNWMKNIGKNKIIVCRRRVKEHYGLFKPEEDSEIIEIEKALDKYKDNYKFYTFLEEKNFSHPIVLSSPFGINNFNEDESNCKRETYESWEVGFSYFNEHTADLAEKKYINDVGDHLCRGSLLFETSKHTKIYGKMIVGLDYLADHEAVRITFENATKELIPSYFISNMQEED